MDATKLIEEAEREIAHMKAEALSAANPYNENTIRLTLLIDLAAALKASEEQNGAIRRGLDWERAEREKVAEFARKIGRERDSLAAANLAANKRIVELEQETDGLHDALRTCDESRKELIDGLKTARDTLDLGKRLIQALQHERDTARAELARLTTPRPIAEAPRDGSPVLCEVPGYGRRHLFWNEAWYLVGAPEYTYAPVSFYPSLPAEGGPRAEKVRS